MRFLNELDIVPSGIKQSVAQFMAYVHGSVNEMSKQYLANERRHNYTTPKSFLELINLYVKILKQKHEELEGKSKRLENGLEKLRVTAAQVGRIAIEGPNLEFPNAFSLKCSLISNLGRRAQDPTGDSGGRADAQERRGRQAHRDRWGGDGESVEREGDRGRGGTQGW